MKSNKKVRKQVLSVIFLLMIIAISVFGVDIFKQLKVNSIEVDNCNVLEQQSSKEVSAWIPYWDKEASIKELNKISHNVNSIENFAAYFDKNNLLFVSDENNKIMSDIKKVCKENDIKLFLSIVNDHINDDGSSTLKDNNLLKTLLATKESRNNHIDNIIKLATDGEYDGVEIDYEKIDQGTLDEFILFCGSLYERLNEKGIKLRIVLEPKEMFGTVQFPKGPDYIMMVYNLYDGSSGPGPKADKNLIAKVAKIMDKIPGKKHLAFSTGGYDWADGKKAASLTCIDAAELAEKYKVKPERDEKSGALHYKYIDDKKVEHIVWYADEETFKVWVETGNKYGYYNISIWRLGGNEDEFIEYINSI